MNRFDCNHLLTVLDGLIDETLEEPEATAARSHLESCPNCRNEFEFTRALVTEARSLPRSVEPDRDLWPGIAGGIDDRRVVRPAFDRPSAGNARHLWLAAAAAAILVVSVTIAYMAGFQTAELQTASTLSTSPSIVRAAYGSLSTDLEQARIQLRTSLDQRRDELSPETWAVVMDNLVVIDDAIVKIETALADNPDDGRLNRQLAVAYRRQIDLLQRANRLPAEV